MALTCSSLAIVPLVLLAATGEPARFALGPGSASAIKRALLTGGSVEGLRGVDVAGDQATLRLTTGVVALRHPDTKPAARAVPAFALVITEGEVPDATLDALAARLAGVAADSVWRSLGEETRAAPAPAAPAAAARLQAARYDLRIGRREAARAGFVALAADPAVLASMGPDLARGLWQAGAEGEAKALAERWLGGDTSSAPAGARLRGRILSGELKDAAAIGAEAATAGVAVSCLVGDLARDLDAAGAREAAHAVLAWAWPRGDDCPEGLALQVMWLTDERAFDEADRLSAELLARRPDAAPYQAARAQVLLARDDAMGAIPHLEALARGQDEGARAGAVRSLLGAYLRVPDEAWKVALRERLLKTYEADPDDHLSGFFGGILLHYDQQFVASDQVLSTLVGRLRGQPRLFIYLAMNAFNQLRPAEALEWVERAAAEAPEAGDPDVHYCRAEILRWTEPARALDELDYYLALTHGSPTAGDHKRRRVQTMRDRLAGCVEAGGPVPCGGPWEHPKGFERALENLRQLGGEAPAPPPWLAPGAIGAGGLLLLLWISRRRRRA